jgi:hypothetical protein
MMRTLEEVHVFLRKVRWDSVYKSNPLPQALEVLDRACLGEVSVVEGGRGAFHLARAYYSAPHADYTPETLRIVACGYLRSYFEAQGIPLPWMEASQFLGGDYRIQWDLVETLISSHREYQESA